MGKNFGVLQLADHPTLSSQTRWRLGVETQPILSILNFRLAPAERTNEDKELSKRVNEELLRLVNERGRVLLYPTFLKGVFVIRVCILSYRTHREHVQHLVEDIQGGIRKLFRALI